uniref:Uncharacterized protein n=1 Tax=Lepeophtheirus salmonis TaxID=72036 RepID=A0A0K2TM64_LEPSM
MIHTQIALVNCGPLSDTLMSGPPNLDIQPSKKVPATVLEVILGIGITSDHLVYRSIIVRT